MASRTPEGKHRKRFIIEARDEDDKKWRRAPFVSVLTASLLHERKLRQFWMQRLLFLLLET